jgi:hypothetical protein
LRQFAGFGNRGGREVEAHNLGAAPFQAEAVEAEMALQMRDAQARNSADLARLDGIELVLAAQHPGHFVEAGFVLGMNRHALVPGTAIGLEVFLHDGLSPMQKGPARGPALEAGTRKLG